MNDVTIRALLVEDNPGDVRLVRELLRDAQGISLQLEAVGSLAAAREALRAAPADVVLLDLGLPDSLGLDTLKRLHAEVPATPIVVMTGLDDHEMGVRAVREGAQDYLIKGQVNEGTIVRAIRYAVERKRTEQQFLAEKAFTDAVLDSMPGALCVFDEAGRAVRWNHQLEQLTSYSSDDVARKGVLNLYPDKDRAAVSDAIRTALAEGRAEVEAAVQRKDGTAVPLLLTAARLITGSERYVTMVGIDISERKRTEEALRESDARFQTWWKSHRIRAAG